jgi:hypothetical protein
MATGQRLARDYRSTEAERHDYFCQSTRCATMPPGQFSRERRHPWRRSRLTDKGSVWPWLVGVFL